MLRCKRRLMLTLVAVQTHSLLEHIRVVTVTSTTSIVASLELCFSVFSFCLMKQTNLIDYEFHIVNILSFWMTHISKQCQCWTTEKVIIIITFYKSAQNLNKSLSSGDNRAILLRWINLNTKLNFFCCFRKLKPKNTKSNLNDSIHPLVIAWHRTSFSNSTCPTRNLSHAFDVVASSFKVSLFEVYNQLCI